MSVYFIIAIALSAMSAVTEVQVARPRLAHVQMVRAERRVIQHALEQMDWNRTRAARLLGISRRQLFDKIQQYGLQH